MSELISREAAIEEILSWAVCINKPKYLSREDTLTVLNSIPTIDAVPVVHGRWEWFEEWLPSTPEHPAECEDCGWQCGRCKNTLENMVGGYWDDPCEKPKLKYCPNCGAKMDSDGNG